MKKLLNNHFVRFCIVGTLGFAINFVLLTVLYRRLGWPLFISQLIAAEISLFNNFVLHHHWTYKGHGTPKKRMHLLIQFHATSWIAIVGSAAIVSGGVHYLHIHYFPALVIASIIALGWNFLWSRYVIWRKQEATPIHPES